MFCPRPSLLGPFSSPTIRGIPATSLNRVTNADWLSRQKDTWTQG